MVDFSFTEEQELFRKVLREWCQKNLPLEKVREIDTKQWIPDEIIKGMADLGLWLMTAPEEHGGLGADWITACIAAEELAYADITISIPVHFLVESSWGFVADRYCTERVREECIRPAIKGNAFIGIGTTEAGGGSDVAAFKTTAKKDGNDWIVNGEKTYISGTEECVHLGKGGFWITARTSPAPPEVAHKGMTSFYLPFTAPGVEVSKRFDDMGRMGISCGAFTMKNVRLPNDYLMGEEGKGFYMTMEGFDLARVLIGATSIGCAQRALEIGMDYLKERKAFGRPIGKFGMIQYELADDYAKLEALRSLVYRTAWMVNERYKTKRFTALECAKLISTVKLLGPPLAFKIFYDTMIWLGAWGYTKECPLEMGMRGIMSYVIGAEGALNIQRVVLVRELLGKEYIDYK
ncbi:MAG: acyl-CoA/acyl-ACP dehydrogenase [Candidatus Bathyarchaeota archaeon]|nr:acyl-CoA/acyl-ACP dehydrogenase [Candidatus Bathyarchaeota archaeon]